jgi:hypothetical protein
VVFLSHPSSLLWSSLSTNQHPTSKPSTTAFIMKNYFAAAKNDIKNDVTWNRVARIGVQGIRATPGATVNYALDKVPIVGWLPRYNYRWLLTDFVAGLTLSLMLIPQSLAYAKIAKIPVQYGLMSSWSPGVIYAFMGTSKGTVNPQTTGTQRSRN